MATGNGVRPWIFPVHVVQTDFRGSHVHYRHLLCGLNNSSKRHTPVGFVERSGSVPYGLEFLYEKLCCYGKMSVTRNNEKDLVFWSTVHVKHGYLMTGVMRKKKNKSLSVRTRLVPVGQRKSYGGVEIFYVILDAPPPTFYLPHAPLHFSLFFFFKYVPGFVLWGFLPVFNSEEEEAKSQLRLLAQVIYFL